MTDDDVHVPSYARCACGWTAGFRLDANRVMHRSRGRRNQATMDREQQRMQRAMARHVGQRTTGGWDCPEAETAAKNNLPIYHLVFGVVRTAA